MKPLLRYLLFNQEISQACMARVVSSSALIDPPRPTEHRLLRRRKACLLGSIFAFGILSLFVVGCAGNQELRRTDAFRRDPGWPLIHAVAEKEVARREGNTEWSHSAYYAPQEHTNGLWVVVASGAYPLNRLGDSIDILIRDSGEVISYTPRLSSHPK